MAKSKRSRRARRAENETQDQAVATDKPVASAPTTVNGNDNQPADTSTSKPSFGNTVDYATEYFYVYTEVRNILIIAVVMFVVLFGLSYLI